MKTANEYLDVIRFMDDLTVGELKQIFKNEVDEAKVKLKSASEVIGYLLSSFSFEHLEETIDRYVKYLEDEAEADDEDDEVNLTIGDIIYVNGDTKPYLYVGGVSDKSLCVCLDEDMKLWFFTPKDYEVENSGIHLGIKNLGKAIAACRKGGKDV